MAGLLDLCSLRKFACITAEEREIEPPCSYLSLQARLLVAVLGPHGAGLLALADYVNVAIM